jgi:sec-independent protein translocase protein TatA
MGLSFWQIAIVVLLVVLLFGRGKLSALMGDLAKGIKSFKKGMQEDETAVASKQDAIQETTDTSNTTTAKDEAAKS